MFHQFSVDHSICVCGVFPGFPQGIHAPVHTPTKRRKIQPPVNIKTEGREEKKGGDATLYPPVEQVDGSGGVLTPREALEPRAASS